MSIHAVTVLFNVNMLMIIFLPIACVHFHMMAFSLLPTIKENGCSQLAPAKKTFKILLYSLFCIFPQFRALAPMYYRGSAAAIIVYDITKEVSFCNLTRSTLCSNFCYASVHGCNISGIWQQSADECTLVAVLYPGVIKHTTPMLKNKQKKDTSFSFRFRFVKLKEVWCVAMSACLLVNCIFYFLGNFFKFSCFNFKLIFRIPSRHWRTG